MEYVRYDRVINLVWYYLVYDYICGCHYRDIYFVFLGGFLNVNLSILAFAEFPSNICLYNLTLILCYCVNAVFDLRCGFDALNLNDLKYLINSNVAPGVGLEPTSPERHQLARP